MQLSSSSEFTNPAAGSIAQLREAAANRWRSWSTPAFLHGASVVFTGVIASRFIIFAIMMLSRMIMVPSRVIRFGGLLTVLTQWDGELWYIRIARYGYHIEDGDHFPHGFFPFYPILIRLMSYIFHDFRVAALVTSHLCLIAAGLFLNALIRIDYKDPRVSRTALMFFMCNPATFFYSSSYSESTFFMLATGALLAARHRSWLVACLCGACLSASRPPGVLIGIPLFLEYVRQHWKPGVGLRPFLHPRILLLGIVPLGLFGYMLYEYIDFHDAFAFSHSAYIFGRSFCSPLKTLASLETYSGFYYLLFVGSLVVALLIIGVGIWLRVRFSYLVYASALTLLYLCSATFEGFPRYLSVVFPFYIVLGLLVTRVRWTYEPLLAGSVGLLVVCALLSANGYWMT